MTKKVATKKSVVVKKPAVIKKPESMMAVVFDNETTGLCENRTLPLDRQPEVIEFYAAAVDLADGRIKSELNYLIRPGKMPLPPKITQITGIRDEDLEGKPAFGYVAPSIKRLLEKAPLIIAHNLSFDKDMIEIEFERLGEKVAWGRGLCTVEQSVHLKGHRLSMGALYEYLFEETFVGAHRAKADVAGLIRIATEMHRMEMI